MYFDVRQQECCYLKIRVISLFTSLQGEDGNSADRSNTFGSRSVLFGNSKRLLN